MQQIQFSIKIKAPKEKVWSTLWNDKTFRDWANNIDEGTYMIGELKEGNEVQFISSVSGYGVTSFVEKLDQKKFVLFRHSSDTKESGKQKREQEWSNGMESYSLVEKDGVTVLTIELDIPHEQEKTFKIKLPKALERIKTLAEEL